MRNKTLNWSLVFATAVAAFVVYLPPLNTGGLPGRARQTAGAYLQQGF